MVVMVMVAKDLKTWELLQPEWAADVSPLDLDRKLPGERRADLRSHRLLEPAMLVAALNMILAISKRVRTSECGRREIVRRTMCSC